MGFSDFRFYPKARKSPVYGGYDGGALSTDILLGDLRTDFDGLWSIHIHDHFWFGQGG